MKPTVRILRDKIIIYRSRCLTKTEHMDYAHLKDPEAKTMEEVVTIKFSNSVPEVIINRNLCE